MYQHIVFFHALPAASRRPQRTTRAIGPAAWKMFLLALLLPFCALGQTTFQRSYEGSWSFGRLGFDVTADGGYVMAGNHRITPNTQQTDMLAFRTDKNGQVLWAKMLGGTESENAYAIAATPDGGFLVGGQTRSFNAQSIDMLLCKLDAAGNLLWTKTYGGLTDEQIVDIVVLPDSGFAILGTIADSNSTDSDFYLLRMTATGDTIWTRTYGGPDADNPNDLEWTSDGGLVMAGQTQSYVSQSDCGGWSCPDIYLIKVDLNGDTLWTRTLGSDQEDNAYGVRETADLGLAVVGQTAGFFQDFHQAGYFVKLNATGDVLWSQLYFTGYNDVLSDVTQTPDGGYLLSGSTYGFGGGFAQQAWLLRTNASGDTLWQRVYGDFGQSALHIVQRTAGYLFAGEDFGSGNSGFYMVKTDWEGESGCRQPGDMNAFGGDTVFSPQTLTGHGTIVGHRSVTIGMPTATEMTWNLWDTTFCVTTSVRAPQPAQLLEVFPNPSTDDVSFRLLNSVTTSWTIAVFDAAGRKVRRIHAGQQTQVNFRREGLPAGVYFYRYSDEAGQTQGGKILLQ